MDEVTPLPKTYELSVEERDLILHALDFLQMNFPSVDPEPRRAAAKLAAKIRARLRP